MHLIKNGGWLEIYAPFDKDLVEQYKSIPQWLFSKSKNKSCWRWRCNHINYLSIIRTFPNIEVQSGLHEYMIKRKGNLDGLPELKDHGSIEIEDYDFKTKPYPYQKVGFEFLRKAERSLLLDPMGSGKTKMMLDYMSWLFSTNRIDKCLVFSPKSVLYNWIDEINKHSWVTDCVVVEGTAAKRKKLLLEDHKIYIMNWECVRTKSLRETIKSMSEVRCCILGDECQKIKSHSSQVSRYFRQVYSPYAVLATGTLIVRIEYDVFSPLNYVSGLWKTWTSFANEFCAPGYFGGWVLRKDMKDPLRDLVGTYSIKRVKEEILPWLPPKVYERRYVTMTKKGNKIYTDMAEKFVAQIKDFEVVSWNILTQLLRLTEITSGFLRDGDQIEWIDSSKFDATNEIVEEVVGNNQKVVLWARFRPTIDKLRELYEKPPFNAMFIDGRVPAKERIDRKNRFQTDPNVKVFIGQLASAGVGIDLHSRVKGMECSTAVRLEQEWSPSVMRQAEDRLPRPGQTADSITIIDVMARDCIDEYIMQIVEKKEQMERELVPVGDLSTLVAKEELLDYL